MNLFILNSRKKKPKKYIISNFNFWLILYIPGILKYINNVVYLIFKSLSHDPQLAIHLSRNYSARYTNYNL